MTATYRRTTPAKVRMCRRYHFLALQQDNPEMTCRRLPARSLHPPVESAIATGY